MINRQRGIVGNGAPNIVNVTSIYGKTHSALLDTTLTTTQVTCAANKILKINSIIVANVDGTNPADVSVYFNPNGGTRRAIASAVTVPAKSTLVVLGKDSPIYLNESDLIEAGASEVNDLEMMISYEELADA